MKIICCYFMFGFFGYCDLLLIYIKGQEHVPKSRENAVTILKLHNHNCLIYNWIITVSLLGSVTCTLKAQMGL